MKPVRPASAGTLESSDCLIAVLPSESKDCEININSVVFEQYGEEIAKIVRAAAERLGLEFAAIEVNDRGAYDLVIEARLETAAKRSTRLEEAA